MKFIRDIIGEKREKSLLRTGAMSGERGLPDGGNPLLGAVDDAVPANTDWVEKSRAASRESMVLTQAQRILPDQVAEVEQVASEGLGTDASAVTSGEMPATWAPEQASGGSTNGLETHVYIAPPPGGEMENGAQKLHSAEAAVASDDLSENLWQEQETAGMQPDFGEPEPLPELEETAMQARSLISPVPDMSSIQDDDDDLGDGFELGSSDRTEVQIQDDLNAQPMQGLDAPSSDAIDVPAPSMGRGAGKGGRMKTRLLGFGAASAGATDPIAAAQASKPAITQFPVGWLVVIDGPGRGAAFTLFNGVTSIGRGDDQTVSLNFGDNSISRENHAAIAFDPEQSRFFVGHGGKANLVRLNDRPVLATEELESGGTIRIGETTLRFVSLCGAAFSWETDVSVG